MSGEAREPALAGGLSKSLRFDPRDRPAGLPLSFGRDLGASPSLPLNYLWFLCLASTTLESSLG